MAYIPKIQKALYHIPTIDPSIPYPFKYLHKYAVFKLHIGQYPCISKTLPGPQMCMYNRFFFAYTIAMQYCLCV